MRLQAAKTTANRSEIDLQMHLASSKLPSSVIVGINSHHGGSCTNVPHYFLAVSDIPKVGDLLGTSTASDLVFH